MLFHIIILITILILIYLKQGKGAENIGGQLYGVQHGNLDHSIRLCASAGPVLVTLKLSIKEAHQSILTVPLAKLTLQQDSKTTINRVRHTEHYKHEQDAYN